MYNAAQPVDVRLDWVPPPPGGGSRDGDFYIWPWFHWSMGFAQYWLKGSRPGRNTEQALLVLANSIDQAWLRNKVVTLVAFDLKGAFNGINRSTLDARLLERGRPTPARKWIQSFMQDRMASIQFDGFINSDLVDQAVDTQGRRMGATNGINFHSGKYGTDSFDSTQERIRQGKHQHGQQDDQSRAHHEALRRGVRPGCEMERTRTASRQESNHHNLGTGRTATMRQILY